MVRVGDDAVEDAQRLVEALLLNEGHGDGGELDRDTARGARVFHRLLEERAVCAELAVVGLRRHDG